MVAHRVIVCNTGTVAATVQFFHDDNGTTYTEATALAWNIPVGTASVATFDFMASLSDASGNLGMQSSVGTSTTFTSYGSEET